MERGWRKGGGEGLGGEWGGGRSGEGMGEELGGGVAREWGEKILAVLPL